MSLTLQWKREPWRKLYVREEGKFAALPLYVRALAAELIKFADDQGVIHLGGKEPHEAIAFKAGATRGDRRLLRDHVSLLLSDGYLEHSGADVRIRNFRPAQMRWDRVRGEHELGDERPSSGNDTSTTEPRQSNEATTTEQRQSNEASTKQEPSLVTNSTQAAPLDLDLDLDLDPNKIPPIPPRGVGASGADARARAARRGAEARAAAESAIEAFNRLFERSLTADRWVKPIGKLLASGYTEPQIRGVFWWAAQEWGDDPERRKQLTPMTLLKQQSSQGYRTFPQYLDLAGELWRASNRGEAPPWEAEPPQPSLRLVDGGST